MTLVLSTRERIFNASSLPTMTMAQAPSAPCGRTRMFISSGFSHGKSPTGLRFHTTGKFQSTPFCMEGHSIQFSWDVDLHWSCLFYFWSNTGMFPRPPWHNHCTMGGKQVSTATENLPALFPVHSLTTVIMTRILATLSPHPWIPLNAHMEKANQPCASLSRSHLLGGIHR